MAPRKPTPRRTSIGWHKSSKNARAEIMKSLKRKFEEGPEAPRKRSEILGHYTPVHPAQSTLMATLGPFSGRKLVEFVYESVPLAQATTAGGSYLSVLLNSAFDFDVTNNLGNKVARYFNELLSSSGPYKSYKVISWKTTWTFVNASTVGVNIFASAPVSATAEADAVAEVDNWPGVKRLVLTAEGGSRSTGTITTKGHVQDVYPALPFSTTMVAAYNGGPSSTCYQNIVYQPADGSSVTKLYVGVKHVMYTELGQVDSIV